MVDMRVIAVTGLKGGVGKTSTAVNLAALAAHEGWRTILWDLDPQGASSHCLRVPSGLRGGATKLLGGKRHLDAFVQHTFVEGLDLVPADRGLRVTESVLAERRWPDRAISKLLSPVSGDYDLVVLDCPPGLGLLAEAVFAACDVVVTPIIPTPLAIRGLEQTVEFVRATGVDAEVLAVLSMVDRRKVLHRQVLERVAGREDFATVAVPLSDSVERMGLEQMPSVLASPRSLSSAALRGLWDELVVLLEDDEEADWDG